MRMLQLFIIYSLLLLGSAGIAEESTESKSYLNEIAGLSLNKYYPPPGWETCTASVVFTLNQTGAVSNVKIRQRPSQPSSGRTFFVADAALEKAIASAAPFPKAPINFKCPARIVVTFTSDVIGESIKSKAELDVTGELNDSKDSNANIVSYLELVSTIILRHYIVPGGYEPMYASISFNVGRSGQVTATKLLGKPLSVKTKQPSALTNAALLKALESSSPLPPPPNNINTPMHLIAVFDGRDLTKSISCLVRQAE